MIFNLLKSVYKRKDKMYIKTLRNSVINELHAIIQINRRVNIDGINMQ